MQVWSPELVGHTQPSSCRESCSLQSVTGGAGGGEKCKVSDFPPPSHPHTHLPCSHTAPFPSLHPQTEKVCHRGTNAIFPGGRRRRNGGGKTLTVCPGGRGKKPEVSELPSCEGHPLRTMTLIFTSLSLRAEDNLWGWTQRLMCRTTWTTWPGGPREDAQRYKQNLLSKTSFGQLNGPATTADTPKFSPCSSLA